MIRAVLSLLLAFGFNTCLSAAPNFVFFLIDDMGYMDIGANNPNTFYETPNIDRLAKTGVRFTDGYAANPVCSPTRYSIMTGKYPSRVDATNFFSGRRPGRFLPAPLNDQMPLEEKTVAEALREAGYRTAFFGKWHLGPTEQFWPKNQGFEFNFGGHRAGMPKSFFSPYSNPRLTDGPAGEHLPARLVSEAIGTLERLGSAPGSDPFFLYLSFYSVHTPLQAPEPLVRKYEQKAKQLPTASEFAEEEQVLPVERSRRVRIRQRHATYAAMVESLDTQIGRVLDKLQELGLEENTVVILTSDNGGLSTSEGLPTSNLPLRGGKGWLYEGGIREPFLIRAPGSTQSGSVSSVPVMSIDFYPTILELAGVSADSTSYDGISLVPLLGDPTTPNARDLLTRDLFWHYPHYSNQGGFPGGAIRAGDWKLTERFEDGRCHLYHIQNDIGEREDLADRHPDRVNEMRRRLHRWYVDVNAKFLMPKPDGPAPWRPDANP